MKAGEQMKFTETELTYRVAFDTKSNRFMAINAQDETHIAYGVTIEEAVRNLRA